MLIYLRSSLFHSPAQTWVNTVNTVGVMGKGVAKEFKSRFPQMFREYKSLCDGHKLKVGQLHLWRGKTQWVLNFPTKTTWRLPSKLEYVEQGLEKFVQTYQELGITSVSFPPLGCGNGNLDWQDVRPVMERYLKQVNIPIFLHNVQVPSDFVAEHIDAKIPENFEDFLSDLRHILESKPVFSTSAQKPFSARLNQENDILVRFEDGKLERLGSEMIEQAYTHLLSGVLFGETFSDERSRKLKSYFFPIIGELGYIRTARAALRDDRSHESHAYFFEPSLRKTPPQDVANQKQRTWQFH